MPEGIGQLQESEEDGRAEKAGRVHLDHAVQHISNVSRSSTDMNNTGTASLRQEKKQTRRNKRGRS
jgi:hypothetical protein